MFSFSLKISSAHLNCFAFVTFCREIKEGSDEVDKPTNKILPSWFVSKAHDKYQLSRDFSRASRSYFSNVLLSTIPVNDMICPPIVDLPASESMREWFGAAIITQLNTATYRRDRWTQRSRVPFCCDSPRLWAVSSSSMPLAVDRLRLHHPQHPFPGKCGKTLEIPLCHWQYLFTSSSGSGVKIVSSSSQVSNGSFSVASDGEEAQKWSKNVKVSRFQRTKLGHYFTSTFDVAKKIHFCHSPN